MRIGVFCSGGDAPGMNACLRAVVRAGVDAGHEVIGIRRGYQGLLDEDFYLDENGREQMSPRNVSGITRDGGTILQTSRCEEFCTVAGRDRASAILRKHKLDALIPIGGDGTFRGGVALADIWHGQIIGCPGTIDNDLAGTDFTIGFLTAVNTAVDAVDKLRDTAESHERLFLVEVMGRHNGHIALYTALMGGAEIACVPESVTDVEAMIEHVTRLKARGKRSILVVVAEGDEEGGAIKLDAKLCAHHCPFPTRVVILGHIQRGGSPVPYDRLLATKLGDYAVASLGAGETGKMAGELAGQLTLTPLRETYEAHCTVPADLLALLERMAT